MANMTLAIPAELRTKMDQYPEINWSEVARQAISGKVRMLGQMQDLLSKSGLVREDTATYGKEIKRKTAKKHRRA